MPIRKGVGYFDGRRKAKLNRGVVLAALASHRLKPVLLSDRDPGFVAGVRLEGGAEVGAADVVGAAEFVAGTLEDDAAGFHYVGALGDFEGVVGVLGGEKDCDAFARDFLDELENLIDEDGREA